jgi:hypothetical protein
MATAAAAKATPTEWEKELRWTGIATKRSTLGLGKACDLCLLMVKIT